MRTTFAIAAALLMAASGIASAQLTPRGGSRQPPKPADEGRPPPQDKQFPLGAAWVAVSLNGKPVGSGTDRPTFLLDQNLRAQGFGGCNRYSATAYPLRQMKFLVGPIALTKKACDKGIMAIEKDFLVALRAAREWDLEGGALVLKGEKGALRLERVL